MEFKLSLSSDPCISARVILPSDDKLTIKSKQKKQFINKKNCDLTIEMEDKKIIIVAQKDYCFDGATIPFGIGKGNMKLLIPALFHDIMCDKKSLINYNRNLSSRIFRELLIMCGIPKWKANLMYIAVDTYQKFMQGWEK